MNIKLLNFVRLKTFLAVHMKIWLWYGGQLPPSCTLIYRLHNVTCQ